MAPSYAQVEELHANYKNHPVAGLRICEKRLSRDSSSIVHRVLMLKRRFYVAADNV